jgi:hypothetical protein
VVVFCAFVRVRRKGDRMAKVVVVCIATIVF